MNDHSCWCVDARPVRLSVVFRWWTRLKVVLWWIAAWVPPLLLAIKLQLCLGPNWKHLEAFGWMGYAKLWLEQEQRSFPLLFGLIRPAPVFGEINGCYSKSLSFLLQTFSADFLLSWPHLPALSLLVLPIHPLCRLIAQWYCMLKSAVSFPTQLSRLWLCGPHMPLHLYSLLSYPAPPPLVLCSSSGAFYSVSWLALSCGQFLSFINAISCCSLQNTSVFFYMVTAMQLIFTLYFK